MNTQKIANLFLEIIPIYKKHFGKNWLAQLEYSCRPIFNVSFDGLGLTKDQSQRLISLGPRVCGCFEGLVANLTTKS